MAQIAEPYVLEAQLKIRSLSDSTQTALQLYREMGATPLQTATPYMVLSFLGHPFYPSLHPSQNVCILVYMSPTDTQRKYFFMAKLQEGNNLKPVIEGLGWAVEEYQEWSFFTKNKSDFQILKDKNSLVNYANAPIKNDIELIINPSIIALTNLKPAKDLQDALNNLEKSVWNIDINKNPLVIEGLFTYKQKGPEFASWLEKNGNRWGVNITIEGQNQKESKVRISLERKDLGNFINQFRAQVEGSIPSNPTQIEGPMTSNPNPSNESSTRNAL